MSEQTPDSSENLSGAEPSMEDILASIRKIISDDEPVAMESPEDSVAATMEVDQSSDPLESLLESVDTSEMANEPVSSPDISVPETESVDLDIDDVLAGLDDDVLSFNAADNSVVDDTEESFETLTSDALKTPVESDGFDDFDVDSLLAKLDPIEMDDEGLETDASLPEADDDVFALLGEDIPLESETVVPLTPDVVQDTIDEQPETIVADDDVEMDALLDDILMMPLNSGDAVDTDAVMSVPAEEAIAPDAVEEQSDLDLVKSLIADLSDDDGPSEADEDLDALLAIPEIEAVVETSDLSEIVAEVQTEAAPDEGETDILGDILNMTLDDELKTHPEDIEPTPVDEVEALDDKPIETLDDVFAAEQDNIAENADEPEDGAEELPSLSEIAAAAEADAVAVETGAFESELEPVEAVNASEAVMATAGLSVVAGVTMLGVTPSDEAEAETDVETEIKAAETVTETVDAEPIEAENVTPESPSHPETLPESKPFQETSMPIKAVKTDAILDDVTEAATAGAFAELNQVVEDKAIYNERGPRIGDLVQDALRPMLKEWLDDNLKGIVERAVTKEVKRISSGK